MQRGFVGGIDRLLGHHCNRLGGGGDLFRDLFRLIHQLVGRQDTRDEPRTLGFRSVHHAAGQAHLHRLGFTDEARETLRAANTRHDAKIDLRLAELRGFRRQDEITQHRELAPAAQRKTVNGRHDGLAEGRHRMFEACEHV